ncbi:type IV pilus biogenesis/stability protein PilW [Thalassotalea marina]
MSLKKTGLLLMAFALTGCVTQTYENDKTTPVIKNESSNNEIAMTRISLGLGYLKMGNTTQAKLNLEKAKRFAPNLVQVYTAFAHYYDVVGEPELATQAFDKALTLNAKDADTLNNYGVFLCKQEKYDKAEKQFLKAIAVPAYLLVAKSYENLALCQLKANNFDKAEHYLDKSIQHSPTSASSLLQMMRLQYAKANYEDAQVYLKRYEKSTRRFSSQALALAYKIYEKQNNQRIAKNYGAMLVKMFPNSFEARQYLLNELDVIEADELAKLYQSTQQTTVSTNKRVVKLSPSSSGQVEKSKPQQKATVTNVKPTQTLKPEEPRAHHIVKAGETLFSISRTYNIQMKAIERWNSISRTGTIKVGDIIYLAAPSSEINEQ